MVLHNKDDFYLVSGQEKVFEYRLETEIEGRYILEACLKREGDRTTITLTFKSTFQFEGNLHEPLTATVDNWTAQLDMVLLESKLSKEEKTIQHIIAWFNTEVGRRG